MPSKTQSLAIGERMTSAAIAKARADQLERRIERVARRCAQIIGELRQEGDELGAKRFAAAAIETVAAMRAGRV